MARMIGARLEVPRCARGKPARLDNLINPTENRVSRVHISFRRAADNGAAKSDSSINPPARRQSRLGVHNVRNRSVTSQTT
jgi:hypothetical protein